MNDYSINIITYEKKGVLDDITAVISNYGVNIRYTHLYVEKNNMGSINLELEHVGDIDSLIKDLKKIPEVQSVELHDLKWLWVLYRKQTGIIYVVNVSV